MRELHPIRVRASGQPPPRRPACSPGRRASGSRAFCRANRRRRPANDRAGTNRTRVLDDPLPDEPASPRKPLVSAAAVAGGVALVAVVLATLPRDGPSTGAPPAGTSDGPAAVADGAPCEVAYRVDGTWSAGFQATVRITNLGAGPIDGWRLGFDLPDGQAVTQLWNGTPVQDGSAVTVTPAGWNRSIPAGGTVEFGFLGSNEGDDGDEGDEGDGTPEGFTLNGSRCR
ncbi:hypothetical protein BJF79_12370 [Actinomadura sp. CNU-125]|nr:hypothetical protein BJF79_12370 [Actinomadura sp. CNU-125]